MSAVVSFKTFCSSWLVARISLMTSSTWASRTTIVVLWSARTSLSNRKLRFAARAITSNTVRRGTSFSSRAQGMWLGEPLRDGEVAQAEVLRTVGVVLRLLARRLFERGERLFRAAFVQQRSRVLHQRVGAGRDERYGERRIEGLGGFHGVSPSLAGRK